MRYTISGNEELCRTMKEYLLKTNQAKGSHWSSDNFITTYDTEWGEFLYNASNNTISLANPNKKTTKKLIKLIRRFG